jgi:hypothetical protein
LIPAFCIFCSFCPRTRIWALRLFKLLSAYLAFDGQSSLLLLKLLMQKKADAKKSKIPLVNKAVLPPILLQPFAGRG